MRRLRLSVEYSSSGPIWEVFSDGGLDDIAPEALPISEGLKQDLVVWSEKYFATYNPDDPLDSRFSTESASNAFYQEGARLWQRLKGELGTAFLLEPYRMHRIEEDAG